MATRYLVVQGEIARDEVGIDNGSVLAQTLGTQDTGRLAEATGGIGGGAAVGAGIGSAVPGIGNVVGGIVGGIAGGIAGIFGGSKPQVPTLDVAKLVLAQKLGGQRASLPSKTSPVILKGAWEADRVRSIAVEAVRFIKEDLNANDGQLVTFWSNITVTDTPQPGRTLARFQTPSTVGNPSDEPIIAGNESTMQRAVSIAIFGGAVIFALTGFK